jgi:hypothetical protein
MLGILHYFSHKILPQLVDKYNTILYNGGVIKRWPRRWWNTPEPGSHEPRLEQRVRDIFRKPIRVAEAIVGKPRKIRSAFIEQVVGAGNYRAHFEESHEGKVPRGEELHLINLKLTKLLEACLISEIGFEEDKIRRAVSGLP